VENQPGQSAKSLVTVGVAFTLSRLIILPVIVAGIVLKIEWLAAGAMAAAVLSDLADGGIARLLGQWTQFGKDLDSAIDFILIHCVFVALYASGHLPTYQFVVIYAAMLMTLLTHFRHSARGGEGMAVTRFGRVTGALEYGYLLFVVASGVVPHSKLLDQAGLAFFAVLGLFVVTYCVECIVMLRKT